MYYEFLGVATIQIDIIFDAYFIFRGSPSLGIHCQKCLYSFYFNYQECVEHKYPSTYQRIRAFRGTKHTMELVFDLSVPQQIFAASSSRSYNNLHQYADMFCNINE